MTTEVYYECVRCGHCCRWPGDVRLTEADIECLSGFLGLSEEDFITQHTRLNKQRSGLALLDQSDGSCAWLDGIDCRLQTVKPEQCRKFPNEWNFPGWEKMCEAIPRPTNPKSL
jgi:hypothetical protein